MTATAPDVAAEPTPYVSLLDRLRAVGETLPASHLPAVGELQKILGGLVHFAEHGEELLVAAVRGADHVEAILTPDRPAGWIPHVAVLADDATQRLDAENAQLRDDLAALREQVAALASAKSPAPAPEPEPTPDPLFDPAPVTPPVQSAGGAAFPSPAGSTPADVPVDPGERANDDTPGASDGGHA